MGDCNACIYVDDYDAPDFYRAHVVRARRPHKCCECDAIISIGTRYERVCGKWDGEFKTYRTCCVCAEIRDAFCCEGFLLGGLWDTAVDSEFFDSMTTGCLGRLTTPAAKAELLRRWREHKSL